MDAAVIPENDLGVEMAAGQQDAAVREEMARGSANSGSRRQGDDRVMQADSLDGVGHDLPNKVLTLAHDGLCIVFSNVRPVNTIQGQGVEVVKENVVTHAQSSSVDS